MAEATLAEVSRFRVRDGGMDYKKRFSENKIIVLQQVKPALRSRNLPGSTVSVTPELADEFERDTYHKKTAPYDVKNREYFSRTL